MRRKADLVAPFVLAVALGGCETLLTSAPDPGNDLESALEGLTPDQSAAFAAGDENFEHAFGIREGLGPLFNDIACAACHPGDGRGTPEQNLVRFSRGSDLLLTAGGPQLQDQAVPGAQPEQLPGDVQTSVRLPPPVFGAGLIEAIDVDAILANEDPGDGNADGISGRAHWVAAMDFVPGGEIGGGPGPQLGRFGRKAQVSSILEQVVSAYHQDMGITSDFLPVESAATGSAVSFDPASDPELPASTVLQTVMYVRLLAPPRPGAETAEVGRGRELFEQVRCVGCHVPALRTGDHPVEALSNRTVPLFSDLLLHDMGPALADSRPDGDASGVEWRTAPLWGLRVAADFLGGRVFFLHDGRTTDLHEAIALHGGESTRSRDEYLALDPNDQAALRAFVMSR